MALLIKSGNEVSQGALFKDICSSCGKPAKYRCPKCSVLSCCLACVNTHKLGNECDGVHDKTSFVSVEDFKERHLLSDYRFLEEVNRTVDKAARIKRTHGRANFLPINLYRLKATANRKKIDLRILPLVFSRRQTSTTFLRYSDRKIFWGLEWKFPLCNMTYYDERIDEETLLGKCLDKYLIPESSVGASESLLYYQSMGHKEVVVLFKNEKSAANDIKYYKLKQNKTLDKNFRGKKIIEYPTLVVVPKIHLSAYPLEENA